MSLGRRLRLLEERIPPAYEPPVPISEEHARLLEEYERAGREFMKLADATDPNTHSPELIAAGRYCRDLQQLERYLLDGEEPPGYLRDRLALKGCRPWSPVV